MVRDGRFPVLLLLGLLALLRPLWAVPRGHTPASWFETQHIMKRRMSCQKAMVTINNYQNKKYQPDCKESNTFLHVPLQSVTDVCALPTIPCKRTGKKLCHQSSKPVRMTECVLREGTSCTYKEIPKSALFTVACEHRFRDPRYPLLPIHLD